MAAVPSTYSATIANPETTTPRRSVAAGSWISSPRVGASSSPASPNVIVAKRLIDARSKVEGRSPRALNGVALPCVTSDQVASATKMSAGTQVP